jgi:hypothetical protein
MPDEQILREKARTVIQNRKLPARPPDRTWGCGRGVGAACSVCELPVTRDELEFEIEFVHDGENPRLDRFRLHTQCFAVWEMERKTALG